MPITATTSIDQITILEDGVIQMRTVKRAFDDDGTKIGERFLRTILEPGDDVSSRTLRVQRITQAVWTQAVIDSYLAAKAAGF